MVLLDITPFHMPRQPAPSRPSVTGNVSLTNKGKLREGMSLAENLELLSHGELGEALRGE